MEKKHIVYWIVSVLVGVVSFFILVWLSTKIMIVNSSAIPSYLQDFTKAKFYVSAFFVCIILTVVLYFILRILEFFYKRIFKSEVIDVLE